MVVTGDQTQIDLPKGVKSGLKEAVKTKWCQWHKYYENGSKRCS